MPKKMIQTQIYLTPRQRRVLFALARQDDVSLAELVRRSIDRFIERELERRGHTDRPGSEPDPLA